MIRLQSLYTIIFVLQKLFQLCRSINVLLTTIQIGKFNIHYTMCLFPTYRNIQRQNILKKIFLLLILKSKKVINNKVATASFRRPLIQDMIWRKGVNYEGCYIFCERKKYLPLIEIRLLICI